MTSTTRKIQKPTTRATDPNAAIREIVYAATGIKSPESLEALRKVARTLAKWDQQDARNTRRSKKGSTR